MTPPELPASPRKEARMPEYKVLTDHEKRFSGNFDGQALETTLNRYAAEGWRLAETAVAHNLFLWTSQLLLILERQHVASSD
jgi:hypothetical protein